MKDFYLVVFGQIISVFGASLLRFVLSLYVLDMTGRVDLFATLIAISTVPRLLAPLGGAIADRFNRRNLMVIYDFSSSLIILCLFLHMTSKNPTIILISIIMVLLSIISSMYTPTVNACVPLLVAKNKIESANGIVMAVQALSDVAAPVLGGILYGIMGVTALIIISGISFFLSAVIEIFIKIPFKKREINQSFLRTIAGDMKDGFIYAVKEPFILNAMIVAALLNLILAPMLYVGAPIILRVTLQSSDAFYGMGMGFVSFVAVLGALTIGLFKKILRVNILYRWIICSALFLLPIIVSVLPFVLELGYYPSFIIFMVGILPIACILTLLSIFVISEVQKKTPNKNLGKIMAIIMAVANCSSPIGQMAYGAMFEAFHASLYLPLLFIFIALSVTAGITYQRLKN